LRITRFAFIVVVLVAPFAAHAQDAGLVKKGEALYVANKCAACHAIAGKGNQKGPLDHVGAKLSADELRQWIVAAPEMAKKTKAERRPFMRAYTNLAPADVDALVAYLQSLK
jgi:mono/diheme cytochrome c family protein